MKDVKEILVDNTCSIKSALKILDITAMSILLLVDSNNALIRTVTDGDIRRLLLAGFNLDDTLIQLPKLDSITVRAESDSADVLILMNESEISQIPVVDEFHRPIGIFFQKDIEPRIYLSTPHMGGFERDYIDQAFDTNWIAPLGPNVDGFEEEFSSYLGGTYAAALNSGTSAIHLALRLLDVTYDDVVLCSSFTFVASANPILYQGATPVFIDSEPKTWGMSSVALEKAIQKYIELGVKPEAIIVVHLYGQSADMDKIMALSKVYDIPVVEDSAESLGSMYKGRHTGTLGKFGIFSFNGNKIITTSGGGMLVSDDKELVDRARFLSTQARDSAPHYEHSEVGYNYRMSNILAGVGRGQLRVLDEHVKLKRNILEVYKEGLKGIDAIEWMPEPKQDYSNKWLSVLTINPQETSITPKCLIQELNKYNIEARHAWKPMHLQPLFNEHDYFKHNDASICDQLFDTSVCLPSSSNMNEQQQQFVISKILNFFSSNAKIANKV